MTKLQLVITFASIQGIIITEITQHMKNISDFGWMMIAFSVMFISMALAEIFATK